MAPTGCAYRTDWVWSNLSNVHVANNRAWFTTFTYFKSRISSATIPYGPYKTEVLGVGDVELDVQTHHDRTGPGSYRTIVLRDVLFVPTAVCNILGRPILKDFGLVTEPSTGQLTDKAGEPAGLLDGPRLLRLRLVGMNATETCLRDDTMYMINAVWGDAERAIYQARQDLEANTLPPLTQEERAWLGRYYGNEWKFLQSYLLDLTDDEERAEGRAILRSLMEQDEIMEICRYIGVGYVLAIAANFHAFVLLQELRGQSP